MCILELGKGSNLNLHSFATHSKLNFSLQSFAIMLTLMFAHVHLCNLNVWSIMWACSRKIDFVLSGVTECLVIVGPTNGAPEAEVFFRVQKSKLGGNLWLGLACGFISVMLHWWKECSKRCTNTDHELK